MKNLSWKELLLRFVSLVPLLLVAAALTCPATDLEPAWTGRDADTDDAPGDAHDAGADTGGADLLSEPDVEASPPAPPSLVPIACEPGETSAFGLCLLAGARSAVLRCLLDAPADAAVSCRTPAGDIVTMSDRSSAEHRIVVAPLEPNAPQECTLRAVNDAGEGTPATVRFSTPWAAGAWVAITEVMANPPGPEPAQEWVEIANLGDEAIDLGGWRLEDEGGGADLPNGVRLAPGGVALLVPDGFVAGAGGDPFPDPTARLVRLGRTLGSSGLRNSGEAVFLLDPSDSAISCYPNGLGATSDGVSVERRPANSPEEDTAAWVTSGGDGPSPGRLR